eukprot:scaffold307_cov162-Amphora_coffeaeformis.AAC.1
MVRGRPCARWLPLGYEFCENKEEKYRPLPFYDIPRKPKKRVDISFMLHLVDLCQGRDIDRITTGLQCRDVTNLFRMIDQSVGNQSIASSHFNIGISQTSGASVSSGAFQDSPW